MHSNIEIIKLNYPSLKQVLQNTMGVLILDEYQEE
jgi:hypothetical protein